MNKNLLLKQFPKLFIVFLTFLITSFCRSLSAQMVCNAGFSHSAFANPDSIRFLPTTTNATSYLWNFGDGSTSTHNDPTHVYAHSGSYYVCLTVSVNGTTCDHCDSLHISGTTPVCNAAFSHYSLSNPDSVHFYPTVTNATSYLWNFGDGTSSTSIYPWHYYPHSGSYYVCLTVNVNGTTCDHCDSLHITGTTSVCNAGFSHSAFANPDSVRFLPTTTNATSYLWNFGDGSSSTHNDPTLVYAHSGSYYVCLTVSVNGTTCDHCDSLHISGTTSVCNAGFSHSAFANPDSVRFLPTTTNATSYLWNFGDGSSSTHNDPTHVYAHAGSYYVCLTVNVNGTTCDHCDSIHITGTTPVCNAAFSHYSLSNPDSVHFYPTVTNATSYLWNFGDGTSSTSIYPWHYYPHSGSYYVCLTVNVNGTTCDHCDSLHISGTTPVCNAGFSHAAFANPDSVRFLPTTTNATSYLWNFGDGSTSTHNDPTHVYAHSGSYYVCLTVSVNGTTCDHCDSLHITGTTSVCNAGFSHSAFANPDSVRFLPTTTNATSYLWNFGDGSSSTHNDPTHVYAHSGSYYVCLTVSVNGTTCDHCDSLHITGTTPVCNAGFSHTAFANTDSVRFLPTTTNATSYLWDFGDGSSSTHNDPTHVYAHSGSYYVCLTVNVNGTTCDHCDSLHITGTTSVCNAGFSHSAFANPDSIRFLPTTTNATSYLWNFGDGSSSTSHDPTHVYAHSGSYYVCLTVNLNGTTCDHCDSLHITGTTPVCNAAFSHHSLSNPDSVHFSPTVTNATSYLWDFGDGTSSTSHDPTHVYLHPGNMNVCLTLVINGTTCTDCSNVIIPLFQNPHHVSIYHNNSNHFLAITVKDITEPVELIVYTLYGKKVIQQMQLSEGEYEISTLNLNSGTYYYTIDSGSEIHEKGKLIIVN